MARGESVLDPALQAGVFTEIHSREVDDARPVLTERERQILDLIAEGMTAPAIGRQLFLDPPRSRRISVTSTRSSASGTVRQPSPRPCAAGCSSSSVEARREDRGDPRAGARVALHRELTSRRADPLADRGEADVPVGQRFCEPLAREPHAVVGDLEPQALRTGSDLDTDV